MNRLLLMLMLACSSAWVFPQGGTVADTVVTAFDTTAVSMDTTTTVRDTTWKVGGYGFLQFNQVTFTNWATGGLNALSLNLSGLLFANYAKGDNFWNTYAAVNYGITKQQYVHHPRKSIDLMEVQTKAGHDLGRSYFLTGLLNLRSQFTDGFAYPNDSVPISKFLAPGYVALSIGIDWKPTKSFSLYFSPVSSRLTVVADQEIADAVLGGSSLWGTIPATYDSEGLLVTHSEKVRFEYGMALVATFYGDIAENVTVGTKLQLYENHIITEPEQIDVIWDFLLNMKVNRWLTASVSATLIYDQDIPITQLNPDGSLKFDENGNVVAGPRVQFNESLGIGLMYRFGQQVD